MKHIEILGARVHNLKGIDISIPKNKLIVATGVSGSGKSSLMFDIVFEQGRKQYLQSLGMLTGIGDENKFDSISGIGPTVAVQQNTIRQSNPRSTVGSRTNILNLLGLLYAGEGKITCSQCGGALKKDLSCRKCGHTEERLDASYFSYNAPNGMCSRCAGRGAFYEINLDKLVPTKRTTLQQVFDSLGITPGYMRLLHKQFGEYLETPFMKLPDEVREEVIHGHYVDNNYLRRSYCLMRIFQGRQLKNGEDPSGIYAISTCSECQGYRVGEEARRVFVNGKHIGELGKMTLLELKTFIDTTLQKNLVTGFGENLLNSVRSKTDRLVKSRLGHLSLYREVPTLSGGEIQRLFLNTHLDSEMDSIIYVLDEPTVGLHESEKNELLKSIVALKEQGNTVIVVEHDKNIIETAEHIIDIGPKAGVEGGQLVYQGTVSGLMKCKQSLTGQYLSGKAAMPGRSQLEAIKGSGKRALDKTLITQGWPCLTVRNCQTNNLKNVTVSLPLGALVGIAGVSGSGKSSLIANSLIPLLKHYFRDDLQKVEAEGEEDAAENEVEYESVQTVADRLEGAEHITGVAQVTQEPIGRNMNSNPATYIGIWDKIRKLFAGQPEARLNKLTAGHFSFNSKGACPECGGSGLETIVLGGDLKMYSTCSECHGQRYNEQALSIRYKNKNISDVLNMRVSEAVTFFEGNAGITSILEIMQRIGMGYIGLGQPTPTLSGGEAQRVKLAKEIGRRRKGNILYVLDEPTTGLSLYDTAKLIELLDELVANGNSVVVIEHDTTVLECCDWIVELGPGGGSEGGKIIAEGGPQDLKKNAMSITGKYLTVEKEKKKKTA